MTRVCVDAFEKVCLSLGEVVEGGDIAIIDNLTCTFVKMNLRKKKSSVFLRHIFHAFQGSAKTIIITFLSSQQNPNSYAMHSAVMRYERVGMLYDIYFFLSDMRLKKYQRVFKHHKD